jgi:leucyl/phenylalanyl-tRNA--protein transferase
MTQSTSNSSIEWLAQGQEFPPVHQAWGVTSDAPGLLCAGSDLSVPTLLKAYRQGIFPWFSQGQPILWWSPSPRMVLHVDEFILHRSLKKTLQRFANSASCEIRMDHAFNNVIDLCSQTPRTGQNGTWILPDMVNAYQCLHSAGFAHSVETWIDGELVGGLYCVAIGSAIFGESMFQRQNNASKIALCALVCWCRHQQIQQIDCQQNTRHLSSLGAREIPREIFIEKLEGFTHQDEKCWIFSNNWWHEWMLDRAKT